MKKVVVKNINLRLLKLIILPLMFCCCCCYCCCCKCCCCSPVCYWSYYIQLWSININLRLLVCTIEFLWWVVVGGVYTIIFMSNPTTVLRLCCAVLSWGCNNIPNYELRLRCSGKLRYCSEMPCVTIFSKIKVNKLQSQKISSLQFQEGIKWVQSRH